MTVAVQSPSFLTQQQVEFWQENGYLLLEGVYTDPFLTELRNEADAVVQRAKEAKQNSSFLWGGKWLDDSAREKLDINGVHDVQFHSAAFMKALMNQVLLDSIADLIGPNIQLHHTKLIVKPPSTGAPFPMHQDYPYFPHQKDTMLAASVHMDDANDENGCLRVVPGSHKLGPLPVEPDGLYLSPEKYRIEDAVACPAKAGDVLVFSYLTIHGSGNNTSERPRRNVLFQLRDPQDHPTVEKHLSRGQGTILRGINPEFIPTMLG